MNPWDWPLRSGNFGERSTIAQDVMDRAGYSPAQSMINVARHIENCILAGKDVAGDDATAEDLMKQLKMLQDTNKELLKYESKTALNNSESAKSYIEMDAEEEDDGCLSPRELSQAKSRLLDAPETM